MHSLRSALHLWTQPALTSGVNPLQEVPTMATRTTPRPAAEKAAPAPVIEETPRSSRTGGINRVILAGRLCADPEVRFTQGGHAVATLRVATNKREEPEFHDVVVWRNLAERAGQYLSKGRQIYVEGRLHGRTWTAQDGTTRRSVEVIAETLRMLDRPPSEA